MATHKELAFKLAEHEERLEGHDEQIQNIFEAIRRLMTPPDPLLLFFPRPWWERLGERGNGFLYGVRGERIGGTLRQRGQEEIGKGKSDA